MNPFLLDPQSRRAAWKTVRLDISGLPNSESRIDAALAFWRQAALERTTIDWDDCRGWPTAWELIQRNQYCESAQSLGLALTLMLASPELVDSTRLHLITDRHNCVQRIVAQVDGWILNHGWCDRQPALLLGKVSVHQTWRWHDRAWHPMT